MKKKDYQQEIERITNFIIGYFQEAGFKKAVVGLSGGIDSALTAYFCKKALGKENVIGLMMPYKASHPDSYRHALLVAEELGIQHHLIPVTPMVDAYFNTYEPEADRLRMGNRMARERMCILYDYSSKYSALVAGTSNKTELLVGYCTQYGDSACAFEPIGHLYKTEVWEISAILGVPQAIIDKNPTADLWENQTDEGELGIEYRKLDEILYLMFEEKVDLPGMIAQGFSREEVEKVQKLYRNSIFKRRLPGSVEEVWL